MRSPSPPDRRRFLRDATVALAAAGWRPARGSAPCDGCPRPCEAVCPADVRIADVLSGDPARLRSLRPHQRLALFCGECSLCAVACPAGLPVVHRLLAAR